MARRMMIWYDDGVKISGKAGTITAEDEFSLTLDDKHIIPRRRIVRAEVLS